VAEIAKQELLKSHPDVYYRAEEIALFVKGLTNNLSDTLVEAAVWLDDIKNDSWDSFFTWHYISRPYNPLGLQVDAINHYNALYAIEEAIKVLANNQTRGMTTLTKSIFMRVLLHVVGDIHQPLHGANLYNLTFPRGDEGGNLEKVTVEALNQTMALHAYWDAIAFQLPNNFTRPLDKFETLTLEILAEKLTTEFPRASFLHQLNILNLNQWSIDVYLDAVNYAYRPLRRDLIIDDAYENQAYNIMKRNIALGGYRLASIIQLALHQEVSTMKASQTKQIKE
jgi:hypothetical protein